MDNNTFKTTSITKFNIKGKTLYVKVIWKPNLDDLFHIKLFDGDITWSGRFSNEFAKKYSERHEETEEQYAKQVKKYLKGSIHNDLTYDFVVNQEDSSDSATFTWKKKFEDSKHGLAILVHGSVPIHRDESVESKDLLLDFLLEENKELRTTIDNLNNKNELMITDLYKCKIELEKFVGIKTSLETSLYGKFLQLLNAKKRRIQVLEGSLSNFSDTNVLDADH